MFIARQLSLAAVIVLVVALAAAPVSAASTVPTPARPVQEGPQTPGELCAAATEDGISEPETREFDAAGDVLQDGVDYWAVLCTEAGAVYLDLYEDDSPVTVNNFVFLAQQGYYNNTTFHRVLPGFMAQGGDPTGTGSGGPGYQFEDETDNGLVFDEIGLLAMANAGADTNGSQFFINYVPTPHLDGAHTIFGSVYAGMEAVERLTPRDPQAIPDYDGARLDTVLIVEDPTAVVAEADSAPSAAHFQYLLDENIAEQIAVFEPVETDFPRDLEAQVAALAAIGGEELGAFMRDFLTAQGFAGVASISMPVDECPENLADNPVWALGLGVADYSTAQGAETAVFDEEHADALVEGGVYGAWSNGAMIPGRIYVREDDEAHLCGDTGVYYRLEFPYGRYVLLTELVLDSTYVNEGAEATPEQFLAYVTQEILFNTIGGPLERGNALLDVAGDGADGAE